jgi:hypothetical protein
MDFEPEPQGCVPNLLRLFFGMALVVMTLIMVVILL